MKNLFFTALMGAFFWVDWANAEPLPAPDIQWKSIELDAERPVRALSKSYKGPIIDTHVHFLKGLDNGGVPDVLKKINIAKINRVLVLPTPNEGINRYKQANASERRRFVELGGEKAGRLCGSTELTTWMDDANRDGYSETDWQERLSRLKDDLEQGHCLGIGEIGPYHFAKKPGMAEIEFPFNFKPMMDVVALAAQKQVPLDVHAEPMTVAGKSYERQIFSGLALWFAKHPDLKLILSHSAMTNSANLRALLKRYRGLMVNFKIVKIGGNLLWDQLQPITNLDLALFEDWALLMEDFPDRFMVGTDSRFGSKQYQGKRYRRSIKKIRQILGSINKKAAKQIAYQNAERVFSY